VSEEPQGDRPSAPIDEPPPVFGTWPRVYGFVLGYLAMLIALLWLFTRYYRP